MDRPPWQTSRVTRTQNTLRWWRWHWLDELRRRLSYLISVQYPQDMVPVVPQAELEPPLDQQHLALLIEALVHAMKCDIGDVAQSLPMKADQDFVRTWPGEHYRLLAGLVSVLKPALAIEVGTWQGAAAAVLAENSTEVVTFDVVPLDRIPGAIPDLLSRHQNLVQIVGDLLEERIRGNSRELFQRADLVFVDGPKDGIFEATVVPWILDVMQPGSLMVLDDIRFAGMQGLWKTGIRFPRIDVGSFGHFSGTGVVFR